MAAAEAKMATETPAEKALELAGQMADMVERCEWTDVEKLAVRLRGAVLNVPEAERRRVVLDVQRVTDKAATAAENAHQNVTEKLSALRRGQAATEAYQSR